jgi:hypothetical protein
MKQGRFFREPSQIVPRQNAHSVNRLACAFDCSTAEESSLELLLLAICCCAVVSSAIAFG